MENIITPLVDQNDNNVGELILTIILTPLEKDGRIGGASTEAHITDSTPVTITEGLLKIKKIVVMDVVGKELLGGKDALYVRVGVDDWQVVLPLNCDYFFDLILYPLLDPLLYPFLDHLLASPFKYPSSYSLLFFLLFAQHLITYTNTTPHH